jgi:Holliday junction resolvase RusA-like endonuclease
LTALSKSLTKIYNGKALTFFCTKPPSVNSSTYNVPFKGRAKTGKYGAWIRENHYRINVYTPENIAITSEFYTVFILPKLYVLADGDNLIKPLFDLMQTACIIKNDNLQREFYVSRSDEQFVQVIVTTDFFVFDLITTELKDKKKNKLLNKL